MSKGLMKKLDTIALIVAILCGAEKSWSTDFTQETKIVAVDGFSWDQFGISVALDGNTALVGSEG